MTNEEREEAEGGTDEEEKKKAGKEATKWLGTGRVKIKRKKIKRKIGKEGKERRKAQEAKLQAVET